MVLILSGICAAHIASAQDVQLFSQTASAILERQFDRSELSWVLLDNSGQVLALHWDSAERPVAPGSLVKPFLALAYGEQHDFVYPHIYCAGTKSRCWLPRGHGWLGIEGALGESCNAYFLSLAGGVDRARGAQTFAPSDCAGRR
jgi:cell division protein FtsI/penicillin-binding protein 2